MKARPGYSAQKLSYQGNELAKGQKYASVVNREGQGQMRTSSGVVMHRGKNSSEIVDIKQNNFYVPMQSDRGGALQYEDRPLQINQNPQSFQNHIEPQTRETNQEEVSPLYRQPDRQPYTTQLTAVQSAMYQQEDQLQLKHSVQSEGTQEANIQQEMGANTLPVYNNFTGGQNTPTNPELVKNLESGIIKLHSNLKQLEGKYIDLANFYKKELVQKSGKSSTHAKSLAISERPSTFSRQIDLDSGAKNEANQNEEQSRKTPRQSPTKVLNQGVMSSEYEQISAEVGRLDQFQEKTIIEEVKTQKLKLENELRNLIQIQTQISDEEFGMFNVKPNADKVVDQTMAMQLNQILFKHQTQLAQNLVETDKQIIEQQFDALYEELRETICTGQDQGVQSHTHSTRSHVQNTPDMLDRLFNDFEIQQDYSFSSLKESIFQIQHGNDQVKLDLKKIGLDLNQLSKKAIENEQYLMGSVQNQSITQIDFVTDINQINSGFTALHKRIQRNEKHIAQLHMYHDERKEKFNDFKETVKQQIIESYKGGLPQNQNHIGIQDFHLDQLQIQNTQLKQELDQMKQHMQIAKDNKFADTQDLRRQLENVQLDNNQLKAKVDLLSKELANKNNLLRKGEMQQSQLVQKLNQTERAFRTQQSQEQNVAVPGEFWKQNCQTMVDLAFKFLSSMRRLQKVVHKKEANVQQEKQQFEFAKKDLEITLKEMKKQLQNSASTNIQVQANEAYGTQDPQNSDAKGLFTNNPSTTSSRAGDGIPEYRNKGSKSQQPQSLRIHSSNQMSPHLNRDQGSSGQKQSDGSAGKESLPQKLITNPSITSNQQELSKAEQLIGNLQAENSQLQRKLDKKEARVQNLQNELDQCIANINRIKLDSVSKEKQKELEETIEYLQKTIKDRETEIDEQRSEVQQLQQTSEDRQQSIYQLQSQLDAYQKDREQDLNSLDTIIANVQQQISQVDKEQTKKLAVVEDNLDQKEVKLNQITDQLRLLREALQQKEQMISGLQNDKTISESQIAIKDKQLKELKQKESQLKGQTKQNSMKQQIADSLVEKLQKELEDQKQVSQQTVIQHQSQIEYFESQISQQADEMNVLKKKVEKKKDKSVNQKKLLAESEQRKAQVLEEKQRIEKKLTQARQKLESTQKEQSIIGKDQQSQMQKAIQDKDQHQQRLKQLQNDFNQLETDYENAQKQYKEEREKNSELANQIREATDKNEILEEQISALQGETKTETYQKDSKIRQLQDDLRQLKSKHEKLTYLNNESTSERERLTKKVKAREDEIKSLKTQKEQEVEDARKEMEQKLKTVSIDELIQAQNMPVSQKIQEYTDKADQYETQIDQMNIKSEEMKSTITKKDQNIQKLQNSLTKLQEESKNEKSVMQTQLNDLKKQLQTSKQESKNLINDMQAKQAEIEKANKETEKYQNESESKQAEIIELTSKTSSLATQLEDLKTQSEKLCSDLRGERDKAQQQLSDFVNQNKFEKESLEAKLQKQLNSTLDQLNSKEDENESLQKSIQQLREDITKQESKNQELVIKIQEAEQKSEKIAQELNEKELACVDYQKTLKENRDRIQQLSSHLKEKLEQIKILTNKEKELESKQEQMLKDKQFSDSNMKDSKQLIDQTKLQLANKDEQIQMLQQSIEQFDADLEKAKNSNKSMSQENQQFKQQIANLKSDFEKRIQELEILLKKEQDEAKAKDEQLEQAQEAFSEFNTEKHDIKAKFKYLMELINLKQTQLQASESYQPSSYKGRDDEVDLNQCFEELEQIVLEFKEKQESKIIELISDKEQLTGTVQQQRSEMDYQSGQLKELRQQLEDTGLKTAQNDTEMRSQLETAMKKINNYKEELASKKQQNVKQEDEIKELRNEVDQLRLMAASNSPKIEDSLQSLNESMAELREENRQLLERLQKAETQKAALQSGKLSDDSVDFIQKKQSKQGQPPVLTEQQEKKLQDIEIMLEKHKRDLLNAKQDCINALKQKIKEDVAEVKRVFTNQEILDKRLKEDRTNGQNSNVNWWNNFLKECKSIKFQEKKFLLLEIEENEAIEYCIVEEASLSKSVLNFIKEFEPDYTEDEFVHDIINKDEYAIEQDQEIQNLKLLVQELKQDRVERINELEQFRSGDTSKRILTMEEMKDDIDFLTEDHKEMLVKVKEVCLQNSKLKLKLAEQKTKQNMDREHEEMSAILVDDNQEQDVSAFAIANNLNKQLRLEDVKEDLENESESVRPSEQQDFIDDDDDNMFQQVVNDLDNKPQRAMSTKQVLGAERLRQEIANLTEALDKTKQENIALIEELQRAKDQKQEEEEDKMQIAHIKGTLIQFLKKVPFTEKTNEDLLMPIFGMMEFSPNEIQELKIARINLQSKNAKLPKGKSGGGALTTSSQSMSREEDNGSLKPKRGIKNLFGLKKDSQGSKNNSGAGNSKDGINLKPIKR